jgi:hypothetical protein
MRASALAEGLPAVRVSTRLSEIELPDWNGRPVRLDTLWRDHTVVLVFIRHFG